MFRPFHAIALVLALFLCAPVAFAFVDPPTLTPTNPVVGQTVSVSVRIGICDTFVERDGYPQITRSGHSIRIILPTVHTYDGLFCTADIGTNVFPIGAYSAGSYAVQVDRVHVAESGGGDVIETLGTLAFDVSAETSSATPVPSLTTFGIGLLAALILIAAFAMARRGTALLSTPGSSRER